MSDSKTGRKAAAAAAAMNQGNKKVITDEQYIKNLRNDLASGLYVTQEGARALLRRFDQCVQDNVDLQVKLGEELIKNERLTRELEVALNANKELAEANEAVGGQQEHTEVLKAIGAA